MVGRAVQSAPWAVLQLAVPASIFGKGCRDMGLPTRRVSWLSVRSAGYRRADRLVHAEAGKPLRPWLDLHCWLLTSSGHYPDLPPSRGTAQASSPNSGTAITSAAADRRPMAGIHCGTRSMRNPAYSTNRVGGCSSRSG